MSDALLNDFLTECREHLEGIETDLLAIEAAGEHAEKDLINRVFRAAHSIKGGAGFFNLEKIKILAHRTETVLDMVRSHRMAPVPEVINVLLISFDKLRELVNNTGTLENIDIQEYVGSLEKLLDQNQDQEEKGACARMVTLEENGTGMQATVLEIDVLAAKKESQYIYLLRYDMIHDIDRAGKSPIDLLNSLSKTGVVIDTLFDIGGVGTLDDEPVASLNVDFIYRTVLEPAMVDAAAEIPSEKIHLLLDPRERKTPRPPSPDTSLSASVPPAADTGAASGAEDTPVSAPPASATGSRQGTAAASSAPETLRITVDSLDKLVTQTGELVLGRNQLIDAIAKGDMETITTSAQRISFVISEMQEAVMKTRLQPIANVFNKFPRVVRDMAQKLGKEIRITIEGKDVELDKTIVDGLSDPLTHMIRNAADHGIETPAVRTAAGKPETGTIVLRAFHEAGQVSIEIADDGKGIDAEKVAGKALQAGLVTPERLRAMTAEEKLGLIFLPGLSTADTVTDISGRGVGMDVVKTNLDHLGGKVEIQSVPLKGSTFRIKLPLTLAIIPSLIVAEEQERYAIAQVNVVELIRIQAAQVKNRIEQVGDSEVVVIRGELIPLVRLADVLDIDKTYVDPETGRREIDRRQRVADRRSGRRDAAAQTKTADDENRAAGSDRRYHAVSDMNVIVILAGTMKYGLIVDDLLTTEEIVVKPLGRHFKGRPEYAGATIMGDGDVALILDPAGIAQVAELSLVAAALREREKHAGDTVHHGAESMYTLLLFDSVPGERCAIPLDLVERVERIDAGQIENRGGRRTMQYRGVSLALVQLSDAADVPPVPAEGELAVIVTSIGGGSIGLVGRMPVAVVETGEKVDTMTHRQKGISGSVIIGRDTVLLVDIFEIIDTVHPEWGTGRKAAVTGAGSVILLVEDSDFFRGQVAKYLTEVGYAVVAAENGGKGWEYLSANADKVTAVVTDIEMPVMTGLELAKRIRSDGRFSELPVIALTSLAAEEEIARGKEAGIDDYQIKLDRDRLLDGLKTLLAKSELLRNNNQADGSSV